MYLFWNDRAAARGYNVVYPKDRGVLSFTLACNSMDGYGKDSAYFKDQILMASITEEEFCKLESTKKSGIPEIIDMKIANFWFYENPVRDVAPR